VVATTDAGTELFIGDAAYTRAVWEHAGSKPLPEGQAADLDTWRTTLTDLKSLAPARIHFCHDR
jgi:glyoxylase-like metal-dependent hydrolase (beta-lactamase superfamily II)